MTALVAATVAIQPAAAAQTDVAEAEGVLLSGSGIVDVDGIAQLRGAYSASGATSGGGTTNQPLDLTALDSVGVRLGNDVDLLGANGILTLGVDGQFATTSSSGATSSSGLVGNDGAIGVGSGTGAGASTLDLDPLLARLNVDTTALSDARLRIGALASTISATRGTTVGSTSDYRIAGAQLRLSSPAVAGGAAAALDRNVSGISTSVNTALGANGALSGTTGALTTELRRLLGPTVAVSGTSVGATANLDLGPTVDGVLAQPITDGAVTLTPSSGSIVVDLDRLTNLNGQPANTPVLTQAAVDAINTSIANILGTQLPGTLRTAVTNAVDATQVTITVNTTLSVLGAVGVPVAATATTTLGALAGSATATPRISVSGVVPGLDLGAVLGAAVNAVVVPPLQTALRPLAGPSALSQLGDTLQATTRAAATALSPVVLLLRQVVDVTVNAQDTTTGFRDARGYDPGARSVHALRLTILPGLDAATVDLATSTVRAAAFAAPTITAPTAGQQFSVPTDTSTRTVTVSGTGEPGAVIALDAGGGRTATATVGTDRTWTTTIAAVPVGEQSVTATQTVAGAAAGTATRAFSVVAQRPLVIDTPTAGQRFTTTGTTAPVTLTGPRRRTPGSTSSSVAPPRARRRTAPAPGASRWTPFPWATRPRASPRPSGTAPRPRSPERSASWPPPG